jgi:hypothetical protein
LFKATENELQKSGVAISKNAIRVLKVTDLEIIACPPTSTLKLKVFMLKFKNILFEYIQDSKLETLLMSFEPFNLVIKESYDVKRVDHDL